MQIEENFKKLNLKNSLSPIPGAFWKTPVCVSVKKQEFTIILVLGVIHGSLLKSFLNQPFVGSKFL